MKNLTVTKKGQYSASNTSYKGSRKKVLKYLRDEALRMRKESREARRLENSVHSINESLHPSKLVTMASFKINRLNVENLLVLMNAHGVIKYTVA